MQGSGSEINENSRSLSRRSIVVKVKDLEKYLRMRGYFTLKWAISLLGIAGFAIYMFREPIKENLSDEVADVASRSLGMIMCVQMAIHCLSFYKAIEGHLCLFLLGNWHVNNSKATVFRN